MKNIQNIIRLKFNQAEINETEPIIENEFDFAHYPWDQCIADNEAKYGKKGAEAVCGAIKAKYGNSKEE